MLHRSSFPPNCFMPTIRDCKCFDVQITIIESGWVLYFSLQRLMFLQEKINHVYSAVQHETGFRCQGLLNSSRKHEIRWYSRMLRISTKDESERRRNGKPTEGGSRPPGRAPPRRSRYGSLFCHKDDPVLPSSSQGSSHHRSLRCALPDGDPSVGVAVKVSASIDLLWSSGSEAPLLVDSSLENVA